MSEFLIGTSGYDYPEWKGIFYPPEIKRADFLSYYATVFSALEINNTFYNMPTANRLLNFYERSEGKIQFSIKANRLLTHEISPTWKNAAADFRNAISPIQEKNCLCSVLFQLPQSFHYTPDNRIYLSKLIKEFEGFPVVIEFRHKDWVRESVFEGLAKMNANFAYCDMPELKYLPSGTLENVQTPIGNSKFEQLYIRLHGRNSDAWYCNDNSQNGSARYDYSYSEKELKEFSEVIKAGSIIYKRIAVFFNNHPNGNGAKNAICLKNYL